MEFVADDWVRYLKTDLRNFTEDNDFSLTLPVQDSELIVGRDATIQYSLKERSQVK